MNVAVTRARRHLAVIGDSSTIRHHHFLKSFFDYVADHGEVRSAHSYMHANAAQNSEEAVNEFFNDFKTLSSKCSDSNDYGLRELEIGISASNSMHWKTAQNDTENSKRLGTVSETPYEKHEETILKDCKGLGDICQLEYKRKDQNNDMSKYTKDMIEKMVADFVNSETEEIMTFDSSMSSRERFWVHEMAEKYELAHWSGGEGKDRCITIKKRTQKKNITNGMYRIRN